MVDMIGVNSSNIHSIGYDFIEAELFVRFRNDGARVYKYPGVPKIVWTAFEQADSKGRFLREFVIPYFDAEPVDASEMHS